MDFSRFISRIYEKLLAGQLFARSSKLPNLFIHYHFFIPSIALIHWLRDLEYELHGRVSVHSMIHGQYILWDHCFEIPSGERSL